MPENIIYTIGHSNHPIDKFIAMLHAFDIRLLADIRTIPRSNYNLQFNNDKLEAALVKENIGYIHIKELGGLRKPKKDTINPGWTSPGFQAYADNMQSDEFKTALNKLIDLAKQTRTAIMCAESVPWNCHRQLTADALLVRGYEVIHILSATNSLSHQLPDFAVINGTNITYPLPLFA